MKRSDVMTLPGSIFHCYGALLAVFLWSTALFAQPAVSTLPLRTAPLPPSRKTPIPSVSDSPVSHLKRLLEADLQQRNALLPPEGESSRLFWQKKLQEYEKLEPEERQRRLQEAQWHWYLMLIMRTEGPARSRVLAQIPEEDRPLMENRLQVWEALPEDIQQGILTHLPALRYFARFASTSDAEDRANPSKDLQPTDVASKNDHSEWNELTPERRQSIFLSYQAFFDLKTPVKRRVLSKIPLPQRMGIQERVTQMDRLSPSQRDQCLAALEAYARMSEEERQRFQQTAQQWKSLPLESLATIRKVAVKVPPLPAHSRQASPPSPPLPTLRRPPPLPLTGAPQRGSTSTR